MEVKPLYRKGRTKHFHCRRCGKRAAHQWVDRKALICVLNRSGKQKGGVFKKRALCLLRSDEYFLNEYSVYRCLSCGKILNRPGFLRKLSEATAKKAALPIVSQASFWLSMY